MSEILLWCALPLALVIAGEVMQSARLQFFRGLGFLMVALALFIAVVCTDAFWKMESKAVLIGLDVLVLGIVIACWRWRKTPG
jgi:hypothetical protein